MIRPSYKYRLKPSTGQATVLQEQLRLCRLTYNALLEYSLSERRAGRGTPNRARIVDRYDKVYLEDLRVDNMMRNCKLSKSIGDAGWGMLRSALTYMAQRSLGVIALVHPMNTSQLCSGCGELVPKPLSERTHRCPFCGLVLDRDINAARNMLRKGIGLEQAEYTPEGEATTTQLSVVEQAASMN